MQAEDDPVTPASNGTDADVEVSELLSEAEVEENPISANAPAAPVIVEAPVADFPEAVARNTTQWHTATQYAIAMLDSINVIRGQHNESWIDPTDFTLVRAWQSVEEGVGFKLCTRMDINEEATYVLIDATTENGNATMTAVTPALLVLGQQALTEFMAELEDGEQLEEDTTNMNEFSCSSETAALLEMAEKSGRKTGILRNGGGSSEILGRRSQARVADFPAAYNTREAYPECALPVQDQGGCGSCYAFAAASVVGERLCIHRQQANATALLAFEKRMDSKLVKAAQAKTSQNSKSRFLRNRAAVVVDQGASNSTMLSGEVMSQQELVSCGSSDQAAYETPYCLLGPDGSHITKFTNGCEGATALNSLFYIHLYGLPTKACVPYESGGGGNYSDHFDLQAGRIPTCHTLEDLACHAERAQNRVGRPIRCPDGDVACIMNAIHEKGPVFATIDAESGLMSDYGSGSYTDGVYVKKPEETHMGRHAVVLHGWGTSESGIDYWLGRNSWGDSWGDGGLFKIRRGFNEITVENEIYYVSPDPLEEPDVHGECVQVQTQEGSCLLINTCETETRQVIVNYLGDPTEGNCGSWTLTSPTILPGESNAYLISNAHSCTVLEDNHIGGYDSTRYYVDVTATYEPYGYTCVFQNTWSGDGTRMICCGDSCSYSGSGVYVFPNSICECAQGTTEQNL
jgi:C1A family cysteine protease